MNNIKYFKYFIVIISCNNLFSMERASVSVYFTNKEMFDMKLRNVPYSYRDNGKWTDINDQEIRVEVAPNFNLKSLLNITIEAYPKLSLEKTIKREAIYDEFIDKLSAQLKKNSTNTAEILNGYGTYDFVEQMPSFFESLLSEFKNQFKINWIQIQPQIQAELNAIARYKKEKVEVTQRESRWRTSAHAHWKNAKENWKKVLAFLGFSGIAGYVLYQKYK